MIDKSLPKVNPFMDKKYEKGTTAASKKIHLVLKGFFFVKNPIALNQ